MDRKENVMGTKTQARSYDFKKIGARVAFSFALGACAYFAGLAELGFGARPFGVALLAAVGREALAVYIGLLISTFTTLEIDNALIYFAVYSAIILIRVFSRFFVELRGEGEIKKGARMALASVFKENIGLRVLSAAIFGLALGASILFSGGLLYYDLFGLLIATLVSPLMTFLLCGYISGVNNFEKERSGRSELYSILGFLTLCSVTVFGAREINVYGVSVSVLIGLTVTFFLTNKREIGYGSLGGLVLGVCYSPMLAPIFVFSALCMGILARFSVALACFAAFFASCAWSFYVLEISALLGVFGGILSACLLYSVLHKIFFVQSLPNENIKAIETAEQGVKCKVMPDSALDGVKLYEMNSRTSAISEGLYKLSQFFDDIKCKEMNISNDIFYDENYNINFANDITAPEYRALSALLAKTMESEENEYLIDIQLSKRLCNPLTSLKLEICGVLVYGVRKKTIYIKGNEKDLLLKNANIIIETLSPLLPFAVDFENYDLRKYGEKGGVMIVFEREKYSASVIRRKVVAKDEKVCGDSVAIFKNKDDRFFAFLSDGMGSGSAASAVSKISVGFLGNMLSSGGVSKELIELLNGFLLARMQKNISECSATLDLFEFDLMNGCASVYKCGAAPSYIYRRGRLFKMRSQSMPIGILNEVDLKKFELELSRGDVIVIVSDGVTGEGSECPWLFDLLAQNLPNRSLERTAELIVKYATAKGTGDDITVILVRVE